MSIADNPSDTTLPILPDGLPQPMPLPDGLDAPYWEGTRRHELFAQRCSSCQGWQWAAEWICHRCLSFDLTFQRIPGPAILFSWQRPWHPVHPALAEACPYVIVLVEFPEANGIRMVGNLVNPPEGDLSIGVTVEPVYEDHDDGKPPFTLVQWRIA
ncbi:MAG: DNA-binding protein [bacterium]|nr:DNA-binding protein [Deltaproteobacteria bacterium]MCP4907916.1 DNA-binding protein [bacterium]